jgi:HPt (histidine-containing phosphotransfer) domain-containing protein
MNHKALPAPITLWVRTLGDAVGQHQLTELLCRFLADAGRGLKALETAPSTTELANVAHSLIGAAGQFGFMRFSRLCAEIEDEARRGGRLNRVADLMAAGAAALAAGESSLYSCASL